MTPQLVIGTTIVTLFWLATLIAFVVSLFVKDKEQRDWCAACMVIGFVVAIFATLFLFNNLK